MVNVTNDPFGNYGYVLGGGPGNYTGYGVKVLDISGGGTDRYRSNRSRIPSGRNKGNESYRARLLHTTRLKTGSQNLPQINSYNYHARGLNHQGQQRQRRDRLYRFPVWENDSTPTTSTGSRRSSRTSASERCRTSPEKQYSFKRNHINLPEIAKRTAGIRTIDTVNHTGFAKGVAASRADTGSLVNALRGGREQITHSADSHPPGRIVSSVPEGDEDMTVLPRVYEDYYFTTLEKMKRRRLGDAYLRTFEQHRKNRAEIVKRKIYNADKVKRQNVLADHMTAMLLGIRREPIHIPTATMDRDDDYADFFSKPKTLRSVEQTRRNLSGAYLNVWNSKFRRTEDE